MNFLIPSADKLSLLDGDTPWTWRGTLDWPLPGVLLDNGPAAALTVMKDRKSVGANIISCGAQLSWWPSLNPANPKWWDCWRVLADLALGIEMRLCIMVFPDSALFPNDNRLGHWDRFYTQLGDKPNIILAGENQPGHPGEDASFDLTQLTTKSVAGFPRILFARDNPNQEANPVLPPGDLAFYCISRDVSKFFNVGSSMEQIVTGWPDNPAGWPGAHVASVLFENWHVTPGTPSASPKLLREMGRELCDEGVIGGNFYSDQCSQAQLLTGIERDCAVEFLGNIPKP